MKQRCVGFEPRSLKKLLPRVIKYLKLIIFKAPTLVRGQPSRAFTSVSVTARDTCGYAAFLNIQTYPLDIPKFLRGYGYPDDIQFVTNYL